MASWLLGITLFLLRLLLLLQRLLPVTEQCFKPSELTPRTSEVISRMLAANFSIEEVAVILGGPEVGAEFSALPFDHLLFTGSTPVGRKVMKATNDNLFPLTLELGGKARRLLRARLPRLEGLDKIDN